MKYYFMKNNREEFSVTKMARVLNVWPSGFYDWLKRPVCRRDVEEVRIAKKMKLIHQQNRCSVGSPRMVDYLKDEDVFIGKNRTARIMRKYGIYGRKLKRFRPQTTDSKHGNSISPNLLNQTFIAGQANEIWLSDITYVPYANKFGYLCVIEDLFNREIIGWTFSKNMKKEMVIEALQKAIRNRQPSEGLIFHSDRGSQYASDEFRKAIRVNSIIQSMSRKGNCYDNAPMESFFKTLKQEEVYQKKYMTFEEAKVNLFDYIEIYYKRYRKHSALGNKTPVQFLENHVA